MSKYNYTVGYNCDVYTVESPHEIDEWIAEDAAEDFHSNHDGWESHWPLTFTISRETGEVIGSYTIERDTVPEFNATKVK